MTESLLYNELERIWKEADMAKLNVLAWYLPRGIKENHKKTSVKIARLWAKI
jgi:hypothetical protein